MKINKEENITKDHYFDKFVKKANEILRRSVGVLAHGMSVEKRRELGRPYKLLIKR